MEGDVKQGVDIVETRKPLKEETMQHYLNKYPLLSKASDGEEVFWSNPGYTPEHRPETEALTLTDIKEAEERLHRFAPYLSVAFPETRPTNGIIESPLLEIPDFQMAITDIEDLSHPGKWLLKCDSHLPISGSIKARGGIYEVLKHAEELALQNQLITRDENYAKFAEEPFTQFFSQYSIAVGSTGNLGMSIGIMSAKLGFNVTVHMSSDAQEWKKNLLRSKGVEVIEYHADYSLAVEEGRKQAELDERCYFIDDENSTTLFLGYSVAALRLKKQLEEQGIPVDQDHPLFVYLPCGVGGGPGGVGYGLKVLFKENVHCFFAEPVQSPCMLIGMMTGLHEEVSVFDFGLTNDTAADGLAVGRPSGFVGKFMEPYLSGIYTITDGELFRLLRHISDSEKQSLEPSALAGAAGPSRLLKTTEGAGYLKKHHLVEKMEKATHIIWATGGSMVPDEVMANYYQMGSRS